MGQEADGRKKQRNRKTDLQGNSEAEKTKLKRVFYVFKMY